MLQFDYTNPLTGVFVKDALAIVSSITIDISRINMSSDVIICTLKPDGEFNTPFDICNFNNVPYIKDSADSPARQFYVWLKTQPQFQNAINFF